MKSHKKFDRLKKTKKNMCMKCKKFFRRESTLNEHDKTAHSPKIKKAVCPLCEQLYSSVTNLRVHVHKHHKKQDGNKIKVTSKKVGHKQIQWVMVKRECESLQYLFFQ